MHTRFFFLLFVSFLIRFSAHAEFAPISDSTSSTEDPSYLKEQIGGTKYFSKEDWENARKGIEYEEPEQSPLEKPRPEGSFNLEILKYVFYGLIVAGILWFLVWLAIQINGSPKTLKKSPVSYEQGNSLSKDELMLLDLEAMIPIALQNKDYYLATRLLYLKVLQKIVILGLIEWRKDQTNRTILGQLPTLEVKQFTKTVFNQYETVWYGQKSIMEGDFFSFSAKCDQLVLLLQQTPRK